MALLEVKRTPDGKVLARRRDGKPLTAGDRVAARRMIETKTTNDLTLGDVVYEFFADEPPGWLYLVVKRPETLSQGPITLGPGLRIMDVPEFTVSTLQDLLVYVSAQNRGFSHWADKLLIEKLDQLGRCGVKVEIRTVQ